MFQTGGWFAIRRRFEKCAAALVSWVDFFFFFFLLNGKWKLKTD